MVVLGVISNVALISECSTSFLLVPQSTTAWTAAQYIEHGKTTKTIARAASHTVELHT
jgi:hypothetical protein